MLEVKNLTYSVERKGKQEIILDNISFSVKTGEILGIAGESGSGKTTMAKILTGLIAPISGSIETKNRNKIQLLFQNNGELVNPFRNIEKMMLEVIRKFEKNNVNKRMTELLEMVNIDPVLLNRKGYALSGGEQQRLAFARLLASNPELVILDEPFSAQDIYSSEILFNLIKQLNEKQRFTFIIISHDLQALKNLARRTLVMYKGEIVEEGETEELFASPKHPYTNYLLKCIDYELPEEELLKDFRQSTI